MGWRKWRNANKRGEVISLQIEAIAFEDIRNPITGFLLKSDKGLVLLGDNTTNIEEDKIPRVLYKNERLVTEFIFTIPLLPKGDYFLCTSFEAGTCSNIQL